MRGLIVGIFAFAVLGLAVMGCGGEDSYEKAAAEGGEAVGMAQQVDDGAAKYNPQQSRCPVCGGMPLRSNYYADVEGKRVYFDKAECVEEFEDNQSEYVDKLKGGMGQLR